MATRTISDVGGDAATVGAWVEGIVPTTSDDIRATATSGDLVASSTLACKSFDFTGYVGHFTLNAGITMQVATTSANAGSCKFVAGMTFTLGSAASVLDLRGNNGTTLTFTSAGKVAGTFSILTAAGATVWQLADNFTATGTITLSRGGLDLNGKTVNGVKIDCSGTLARALTFGAATVTLTGASQTVLDVSGTTQTISAALATITCSGAAATFASGGQTFGTVNLTGTGTVVVTGAIVATTFTAPNASQVTLPAATTVTFGTFTMSDGIAGTPRTLRSSSAASAATLSLGNTLVLNHFTIQDITAAGAGSITAYDSTSTSGNTNVTFAKSKKLAMAGVG